jgi:hypothetical protein
VPVGADAGLQLRGLGLSLTGEELSELREHCWEVTQSRELLQGLSGASGSVTLATLLLVLSSDLLVVSLRDL